MESKSELDLAVAADGPIPRERVVSWIDDTTDSDLLTLSKLYRLTGEGYYRIEPELGMGATCALIQRYLVGCLRDDVQGNDEIQERFEAAQTVHSWFRTLVEREGTEAVLTHAASAIKNLYLESDSTTRGAIETGFLEHALETKALRVYFQDWAADSRLQPAWSRALKWGEAHTDYMAGLEQLLRRAESDDQD